MLSMSLTCLTMTALTSLGWLPILEPMPVQAYWIVLLLPLVVIISVVYKTIKLGDLRLLPRESAYLSMQIVVFMVLAALLLWFVTELV